MYTTVLNFRKTLHFAHDVLCIGLYDIRKISGYFSNNLIFKMGTECAVSYELNFQTSELVFKF
jgi:hypothetical protein